MTCDLLVKSCARDAARLAWLLRSVARFARGFREVVVLFPADERAAIDRMNLTLERVVLTPDSGDRYVYQQLCKLQADRYTDAEFVLHLDSDCVFTGPASPDTYFTAGRPQLLYAPYAALAGSGVERWRPGTERALARPVELEFMRRLPLVYPRDAYPRFRDFVERTHGTRFETFVTQRPPHEPPSEYNWLGAYCWSFLRDRFHWIDTTSEPLPPNPVRQLWSWAPLGRDLAWLQELLG